MTDPARVTKSSGETEAFSDEKMRDSLLRAGATSEVADRTIQFVKGKLPPDVTSDKVHACSWSYLKKHDRASAARYSLKRALTALGPSGYMFEHYIAAILSHHGYHTKVGEIVQGFCVEHEIDVWAHKDNDHILIECKFHNQPGSRSDVKVAMYTTARFEDVVRGIELHNQGAAKPHQAWLVTNTKCTEQAVRYARCKNLHILAWRYPANQGLEHLIESRGLYPVTALPSLTKDALAALAEHNVLLARDLCGQSDTELAARFGIDQFVAAELAADAAALCGK